MEVSTGISSHLLLFYIAAAVVVVSVHGQVQTGFISIDCGARENFNFVDIDTGISYTSDGAFIETGVNKNISEEYAYPNNPMLPQPLSDLRSFPQERKNCYSLKPTDGKGSLNLIRATFMYGNYDGQNKVPEFDLYLDVNFWFSVKFSNASDIVTAEIISNAPSETIYVCLVNTGFGVPFISALELRPLNSSLYNTETGTSGSLILFNRLNFGASNGTGRYRDDSYDRIWSLSTLPSSTPISTSLEIDITGNGYKAPLEVINTAAKATNGTESLELYWTATDPNTKFYTYMHFAELEQLGRNQSRKFNISWNGSPLFGPFSPRYLFASTLSNSKALVGKEHRISIRNTGNSSLPPIINAVEIYMFREPDMLPTYGGDVDAIMNVKTTYQMKRNWMGDPCGPKNYSWEGLICRYNDTNPPIIISLNLTSSSLSGGIAASIAKLSSLESLDLSNNSLSGSLPEFLKDLHNLKFLNLKGNNLSGSVPSALLERSKAGSLTLSVDDQNLCGSGSCKKKKKNIIVPIVASLSSVLVLLILLIFVWRLRKRRQSGTRTNISADDEDSLGSKKRRFTYDEVVSITNNFQRVIGKGGFGTVYHGTIEDGTQVAVKMLSPSSKQGSKEFRTEAELLIRVHHRSLVSFVGYCNDGNNMALISEYMANGNLKDYVSGESSRFLSWKNRLGIAIDAAQGLEYLHHGCKPPIIHRDVKTANILLSESLDAKIADLGLSRAFSPAEGVSHVDTAVMGTRGYLDPEYFISQKLTEKSDVYSFGIVLLELITGAPVITKGNHQTHIVQWVSPLLERGEITSAVDQRLQHDFDTNSVWKALEVAMSCTAPTSSQRPPMNVVLAELKECLAIELSSRREETSVRREEVYIVSNSSSEVFSMDIDSMTGPSAR